jgi:S1-C subfamily serine protease
MQNYDGYGPLPRRRGSGNWLTHAIMGVLGAGLAVAVILGFFSPGSGGSQPGIGAVPAPPASAAPLASGQQDIVTKIKPGLVLINTTLQFESEVAAGTGMVLNTDGLVLTNNHVIEGSTKITATVISTGKTYQAKVVGYDQTGDVALIQLQNASGLTTVPIGNSSSVKAGNAVVALGNAEGQGKITATAGHITALNQTITASDEAASTSTETLHGMIQTNADIVPGDSGGALASSVGVIGMNTAGDDSGDQQGPAAGSRSRSTRRYRSPGRSPPATPAPSLPSATRRSWASSLPPDQAVTRRRRRSSKGSRTAASAAPGAPRGATTATLT